MDIKHNIVLFASRSALKFQKHSPIILTGVGVLGIVTAGVMAARATLKLEDTLDVAKARLERVADADGPSKTTVVVANSMDLVKLYAPSVTLAGVSLACILGGQGILHKRNAALAMAYKGLERQYTNYRGRVVEQYGEDVDRDFHLGLEDREIVGEDGDTRMVKAPRAVDGQYGEYTFIFGPDNPNWVGIHERNEWFLTVNETTMNDLLRYRGHVFLNEVLERLGFEHTKAGAVTGWVLNGDGDNFINFRMYKLDDQMAKDFDHAEPGHILLDFNVDGLIWDKI